MKNPISSRISLCVDGVGGRCPQQNGGVLSEGILFQRLSRLDVTRDKVASDISEEGMKQTEAVEQMMLEGKNCRCDEANHGGEWRTSFQASKEERF